MLEGLSVTTESDYVTVDQAAELVGTAACREAVMASVGGMVKNVYEVEYGIDVCRTVCEEIGLDLASDAVGIDLLSLQDTGTRTFEEMARVLDTWRPDEDADRFEEELLSMNPYACC